MSSNLSFQDAILRLQEYWKNLGCLVRYPYYVQVGAGTMNPATSLQVLGPEPWNVVYVEPSIRPDDGRFGDNPNRMQMHHQLQVILKPDPGNPQELFLKSLEAIGINPREHDIRFVEDNWESPALGAWGLGWEVWLDGQEITQFTYFQQAGSLNLDPVCVEITYGLDRIILALQDKRAVWEIDYNENVAYRELFLQSEIEHCHYYFEVADVDALRSVYDSYERESLRCIEAGLVVPAHDYNLKCSHLFNVMDTRGAVGVTERANYFKRMRNIARKISQLFLEQREAMGYPLAQQSWVVGELKSPELGRNEAVTQSGAQTFLLEIGQEELPPADLISAIQQLRVAIPEMLESARLSYESIEVDGTPRRLVAIVQGLAERQPDLTIEVKGPPLERAQDSEGNWNKAALGFAQSKGIPASELRVLEEKGKKYVGGIVHEVGQSAESVLAAALPKIVAGIKFTKNMRWNQTNVAYSRPLRWLIALYGQNVVPFEYAGVLSGRISRGLRPHNSPRIEIGRADQYEALLAEHSIMWRTKERSAAILRDSAELATKLHGTIPHNPALLEEVTNLVEAPTPFIGSFEDRFLALPPDILVAVMKKHQRYFPIYNAQGEIMPYFVAVRNGDMQHLDIVRHGNEQVIRARFSDATFFFGNDKGKALAEFIPDLAKLTFQTELGSMLDKLRRLEQTTPLIGEAIGLSADELAIATRAAGLSKADLATNMVVEMTSLQGIMGGYYAKLSGESAEVASAIAEQYNGISQTKPGLALALADRLDSLVGLTAAGLLPKGSNDPFALRRATIQLIENSLANQLDLDLRALCQIAAQVQPVTVSAEHLSQINDFITGRLEVILREQGFGTTIIKAVLGQQAHNPYRAKIAAQQLSEAVESADWQPLLDGYARCQRITRHLSSRLAVDSALFTKEESRALYEATTSVAAPSDGSIATLVAKIRTLLPMITAFFDTVLVMDEDLSVRNNHLGLLQMIVALAEGSADLSQLEGF